MGLPTSDFRVSIPKRFARLDRASTRRRGPNSASTHVTPSSTATNELATEKDRCSGDLQLVIPRSPHPEGSSARRRRRAIDRADAGTGQGIDVARGAGWTFRHHVTALRDLAYPSRWNRVSWPEADIPAPADRRYDARSSTCQPASPDRNADRSCTCPPTGHGRRPGLHCGTTPSDTAHHCLRHLDHPPQGPTGAHRTSWTGQQLPHAHNPAIKINKHRNQSPPPVGGSRLRPRSQRRCTSTPTDKSGETMNRRRWAAASSSGLP